MFIKITKQPQKYILQKIIHKIYTIFSFVPPRGPQRSIWKPPEWLWMIREQESGFCLGFGNTTYKCIITVYWIHPFVFIIIHCNVSYMLQ